MITLSCITIFPFKSLDGVSVETANVLPTGALESDRKYALVDKAGKYINAKRSARFHFVRTSFDLTKNQMTLSRKDQPSLGFETFSLDSETSSIEEWFSDCLETTCKLVENETQGHPDDLDSPGPTVISSASLLAVGKWFDLADLNELRNRFRMNLELTVPEAFWEDRLVGTAFESPVRFRIADVEFLGRNSCARCAVPTRSPETAEAIPSFAKHFIQEREKTLPAEAQRHRFDHFYRLGVNTSLATSCKGIRIAVGDTVEIIDTAE